MSGMSAEAICGKIIYLVAEALEAWWLRLSKPKPRYLQTFKKILPQIAHLSFCPATT
jgi:hypothetical protein